MTERIYENDPRPERRFHESVWATANEFSQVERAVEEGRDLAYMVLARVPDTEENDTLRYYAQHWLDTHGPDPLKERRKEAHEED